MSARKGGFTIIEVTLVMAITSVLAVALLVGWVVNVNTQSYRDSVNTLMADLQQQFDDVYNTSSDRENNITCNGGVPAISTTPVGNNGSSECMILGKYIRINNNRLTMQRIVGKEPQLLPTSSTDIQAITAYAPVAIPIAVESANTRDVAWGVRLYRSDDTAKSNIKKAVVIVRSPTTGSVHTFSMDVPGSADPSVMQVIGGGNQRQVTLCMEPASVVASSRLAVTIAANASTHESIGTQTSEGANKCA